MTHHQAACIAADASVISATNSLFQNNEGGDVIFARSASTVDVAHSTFKDNIAKAAAGPWQSQEGGATISLWEASVANLEEVSFIENTGVAAGAILVTGESIVAIGGGLYSGNTASATDAAGAAIFANQHAQVHSSRCSFDGNSAAAQVSAGVIYAGGGAEIILTDATLSNNQAVASLFGAGAVYADKSHISLIRANISSNTATGGTALTMSSYADALYVLTPLKVFIQDSSFDPLVWGGKTVSINPQILPGPIIQGSCQQHPCLQGSSCSYSNFSSSCQPCPEGTYSGDGILCDLCPPGTGPSADQTRCEPCGGMEDPLAYSTFGVCLECHGDNVVSDDRQRCGPQGSSVARDGV